MNNSCAIQKMFQIVHASDISAARRWGSQLGDSLGFDETTTGKLSIIITEAATNILKHALQGMLLISPLEQGTTVGIEIIALDRGPGMLNIAQSRRDGISTSGTAGTGLGAMGRLADSFDIYSAPGMGTGIYMRILARHEQEVAPSALQVGAICIPLAGEEECGDAWAYACHGETATLLIADGLGHGSEAAVASNVAVKTLQHDGDKSPETLLNAMHQALRPTRGAAIALMKFDFAHERVSFAGIGNITACVLRGADRKQLISHNGIVGNNMRKVQEFSLPWSKGCLAIMCSDGIGTQWDLDKYPGLCMRHPALIGGIIYRDFARTRDDATVAVVRYQ